MFSHYCRSHFLYISVFFYVFYSCLVCVCHSIIKGYLLTYFSILSFPAIPKRTDTYMYTLLQSLTMFVVFIYLRNTRLGLTPVLRALPSRKSRRAERQVSNTSESRTPSSKIQVRSQSRCETSPSFCAQKRCFEFQLHSLSRKRILSVNKC